jgi:hypothetical protein
MLAQPKTLVLTVGQDAQRMGRVAVQQALRAIRGQHIAHLDTYIPTTEFTKRQPAGTPDLAGRPQGRPAVDRGSHASQLRPRAYMIVKSVDVASRP